MRVVAGELRGRRLLTPPGNDTRPTTDKVRQAVFNALDSAGLIEDAVVVDLFAGSGAMGIEALSRGARSCTFVERDRIAVETIRANVAALGLERRTRIVVGDAAKIGSQLGPADLVIADPPYLFEAWETFLDSVSAATVVAESDREVPAPPGWEVARSRRYGRTVITWLHRASSESNG